MATETSVKPVYGKFTITNPIFDNVTITDTTAIFDTPTPHNDIETVKTHVQIAPNVYLKIIDEGGRAIFHICENLAKFDEGHLLAGEFLPEHYKKNKKTDNWQYYNYKCNKCGVMIPNELTNKADVIGELAKFKTNNG